MRTALILILGLCFLNFGSEETHKYYVSTAFVDYNSQSNSLEISIRIFTDDLETAIAASHPGPLNVGEENESPKAEDLIREYVASKFVVSINAAQPYMKYIGKECELDLTYIYFEIESLSPPNTIEIDNSILLDIYEEQVNVVYFSMNGFHKTLMLDITKDSEIISI